MAGNFPNCHIMMLHPKIWSCLANKCISIARFTPKGFMYIYCSYIRSWHCCCTTSESWPVFASETYRTIPRMWMVLILFHECQTVTNFPATKILYWPILVQHHAYKCKTIVALSTSHTCRENFEPLLMIIADSVEKPCSHINTCQLDGYLPTIHFGGIIIF